MLQEIDFAVIDFIQRIKTPLLDRLMVLFTTLGNAGLIWIMLAVVLIISKTRRKTGIIMAAALILGFIAGNVIMKNLFERPRPFMINTAAQLIIPPPSDFSFPSGHTLAGFAAAFSLLFCGEKRLFVPFIILASIIAFSRLYLYVHFPSDVLGGAITGILCAFAARLIASKGGTS